MAAAGGGCDCTTSSKASGSPLPPTIAIAGKPPLSEAFWKWPLQEGGLAGRWTLLRGAGPPLAELWFGRLTHRLQDAFRRKCLDHFRATLSCSCGGTLASISVPCTWGELLSVSKY